MYLSAYRLRRLLVPELITIGLLDWALVQTNPYSYYIVLRSVICGVCIYLAVNAYKLKKNPWVWVFTVTAIVYNPLIRVYLTNDEWSLVYFATILIIATSVFQDLFQRPPRHRNTKELKAAIDSGSSTGVSLSNSSDYIQRTRGREENISANWHIVLGVPRDASLTEINRAYKIKMSQNHPDKVTQLGDEIQALAEQKTKEINVAFNQALRVRS